MKREERREELLKTALKIAEKTGYMKITNDSVAEAAGKSKSLIQFHFHSIQELKRAVMDAAIRYENVAVLAQGLGLLDEDALSAPKELKDRALKFIEHAV
jgi:AcrR family transcriptional regulator